MNGTNTVYSNPFKITTYDMVEYFDVNGSLIE